MVREISKNCIKITESINCIVCDGFIGIHKNIGICPQLCESWYEICKNDYIVPISEKKNTTIIN